jgi:short-subunit dehydrogenase
MLSVASFVVYLILLIFKLIKHWIKSDDARVLFLSSSVGRSARAYWGAYGVSKFAIEGLSKTLSEELEKTNIKVTRNFVDANCCFFFHAQCRQLCCLFNLVNF